MTPALILLRRCCDHASEASYIVPRLVLDRRPRSRTDRLELDLWHALSPIIRAHPGDRLHIRNACPERWRFTLDIALATPDWLVEAAQPTPRLLQLWNTGESRDWRPPALMPARVQYAPGLRDAA